jgi:PAS domain S-box-containing protein
MPTARENPVESPDPHTEAEHTEALLKTGALQKAIFNSANFSSIATDAKGVIQIFNVGAERMLGYAAAEVVNTISAADLHDPQEVVARAKTSSLEFGSPIAPGFEALVFKAARGIEDIYELTKVRKDGSCFPAVVSVTALRDPHDAIIGYLLIGTDNSARQEIELERKRLDQRLRDQQFYTRSLIESNIDAPIAIDPRAIITNVNKQTEALIGYTRDELIGAPFKDYFSDPVRAEAGINRVLAEGKVTNYELTARASDGRDLKLPKVDGLEVLRQIKGDDALKTIPIVMMTSSRQEQDLLRSYQLGVNAYVVKPLKFQDFVEAVKQVGVFWAVINEVPARVPGSEPVGAGLRDRR